MPKGVIAILLGLVTVFAIFFFIEDKDNYSDTFEIDATFDGSNVIVTFSDKSKMTDYTILQMLGMEEPFQKTFNGNSFVEVIPFSKVPKYGWKAHPIIVDINHTELGHVQLKTEVHLLDEPAPPVIYGVP